MLANRFALIALIGLVGSPVAAATVSATVATQGPSTGGCSQSENVGVSVSATCAPVFVVTPLYSVGGSADARASFGSIGVRATATTITPDFIGGGSYFDAIATSWMDDALSFSIETGSIVIPVDFAGGIDIITDERDTSRATVNLSGVVGGQFISIFDYYFYDNAVQSSTGSLGVTNVVVPIVNGRAGVFFSLEARALANMFDESSESTIRIDFFSSARLLAAQVFDADGNRVDSAFIGSDSGFDYLRGVVPHGPAPVPLPATGLILATGVVSLVALRKKFPAA
jgi:hypothetical protein